jgi:tRNA modification GTPase
MEGLGASSASKLLSFGRSSEAHVLKLFSDSLEAVSAARGRVEAAIDFAEAEEEQSQDIASAELRLREVERSLQNLLNSYDVFARNSRLPSVVLLGKPNAGKSTLLNLLVGGQRSLVSEQAGTTRDYVEVNLKTSKGHAFRLLDTAGLRHLHETQDAIEVAGMELGLEMMRQADLLVWLQDLREESQNFGDERIDSIFSQKKLLKIQTHADLVPEKQTQNSFNLLGQGGKAAARRVLDFVDEWVLSRGTDSENVLEEGALISQRQETLVREALAEVREALRCLRGERPLELVGDSLRHLDSLIRRARGEGLSDDYIGQIFTQFCLGK